MQLDLFAFEPPKTKPKIVKNNNWIDWVYTPKKPLPAFAKEKTILFGTPDGNLLRDDPHQQKLPLRELDDPIPSSIRNVHDLPVIVKSLG